MWVKLTHIASGKPIYINTMHIVSVWNYPNDDVIRVTTVEDVVPWQVKESAETVIDLIKIAESSEEQENA